MELKIELRLKLKADIIFEFLTPKTIKLLGSTESKITKNKNGENVPHLEVVELVLVHCSLVNNDYQQCIMGAFGAQRGRDFLNF